MGNPIVSKVKFIANISVIAAALIGSIILVKAGFFSGSEVSSDRGGGDRAVPAAGARLSLQCVNWAGSRKNLLLVFSTESSLCRESAPFYQRLAREASKSSNVRLIAALPQEATEGKKFLSEMNIPAAEVLEAPPEMIGVGVFPTLILVDSSGIVEEVWAGRLPADKASEVLSRLRCETCSGT